MSYYFDNTDSSTFRIWYRGNAYTVFTDSPETRITKSMVAMLVYLKDNQNSLVQEHRHGSYDVKCIPSSNYVIHSTWIIKSIEWISRINVTSCHRTEQDMWFRVSVHPGINPFPAGCLHFASKIVCISWVRSFDVSLSKTTGDRSCQEWVDAKKVLWENVVQSPLNNDEFE